MRIEGRWLRGAAIGLSIAALALCATTLLAVRDGDQQMQQSDAAFDRGDLPTAILHARAAATHYAPGAPHVRRAYERLVAIAVGAESAGQKRTAEAAWRAVRAAALETRHLWVPHAAELARANESLARLGGSSAGTGPEGGDARVAIERARQQLARDDAPNPRWLLVLIVGFACCMTGLVWVGVRGVAPDGALRLGRAKLGFALSLFGMTCWTLAVWKA